MFGSDERSCWDDLNSACPVFDVSSGLFWFVFVVVLTLIFVDVSYYLRICIDDISILLCRQPIPPRILSTHVYKGLCVFNGLDLGDSMNGSGRFLRECHFALRVFLRASHLRDALKARGAGVVNSSNNLKFRKAVSFLQAYAITTRVVWWDGNSLYLEQKLVRTCDQTVCAVNYSRQRLQGVRAQELMDALPVCSCLPDIPPEIASWMVCIKIVNRELEMNDP